MVNNRSREGLIVGIDISKYSVQMSCLSSTGEVQTISTTMGSEQFEIPLGLFRKKDTTHWQYGEKARSLMKSGEGIYVDDLWEGVRDNRELVLEEESFSYEKLMAIYLDKVLGLIGQSGYTAPVETLVFTVESLDAADIRHLQAVCEMLATGFKTVYFIDYEESMYAYVTSMKKELWNHEVFLFYYTNRSLKAYRLYVNQKKLPFTVVTEQMDYGDVEYDKEELKDSEEARQQMDERFLATLEELFGRRVVSCVYLIGDGFLSDWMKKSLRYACRGRRVFQGNNLFTKGACYAGAMYEGRKKPVGAYASSQSVACDVKLPVVSQGKRQDCYAAKKGEPWYRAGIRMECLLEDTKSVKFELISQGSAQAARVEELELLQFPERPRKASKVRITIRFTDAGSGHLVVEDLGFGEFYKSSGMKWEKTFKIAQTGSDTNGAIR